MYCQDQSREGHGVQLTPAVMGWLMNVSIHNQAIMVDGFSQMAEIRREIARLGAKVDGNNAVEHQGTDLLPQSTAQSRHRKRHSGGDSRNDERRKRCKVSDASPSTSTVDCSELLVLTKEDFKAFNSKYTFLNLQTYVRKMLTLFDVQL